MFSESNLSSVYLLFIDDMNIRGFNVNIVASIFFLYYEMLLAK